MFSIKKSIDILERTPFVVEEMLSGLDDEWILVNEGGETWSAYDILGHLIHGEKTDWIARLQKVLSDSLDEKKFTPFDRFAQFNANKGKSLQQLLGEFKNLRAKNIIILQDKNIQDKDFGRTGFHPDFGNVTLRNLIATWVVHDLNHLAQIARVMAYQYKDDVGPWKKYLRIVKETT